MFLKLPALLTLTFISALITYIAPLGLVPAGSAFIAKPLTTILIILYAWPRGLGTPLLRRWVLTGLFFSLLGDVALMLPGGFVPGLLVFLLAHLAYLWAFTRVRKLASWPWSFVGYGLVAAVILAWLWSGIPAALHGPVAAYVICLSAMAAQAGVIGWRARGDAAAGRRGAVLALGGLLFFCSDGCLAINRFGGPAGWADALVLPTYWAAQWCIASWLAPAATAAAPSSPRLLT